MDEVGYFTQNRHKIVLVAEPYYPTSESYEYPETRELG